MPLVCINGDEMANIMWEEVKNHVSYSSLIYPLANLAICGRKSERIWPQYLKPRQNWGWHNQCRCWCNQKLQSSYKVLDHHTYGYQTQQLSPKKALEVSKRHHTSRLKRGNFQSAYFVQAYPQKHIALARPNYSCKTRLRRLIRIDRRANLPPRYFKAFVLTKRSLNRSLERGSPHVYSRWHIRWDVQHRWIHKELCTDMLWLRYDYKTST